MVSNCKNVDYIPEMETLNIWTTFNKFAGDEHHAAGLEHEEPLYESK